MTDRTLTMADYVHAFDLERKQEYPIIDAFEAEMGYAVDRDRLEAAARVLACPVKVNPPNWQHGRVIYARARRYLADHAETGRIHFLDIGTAKGFSVLCMVWAAHDANRKDVMFTSVDVIPPTAKVRRNTVLEVGSEPGFKTLAQIIGPWPELGAVTFWSCGSHEWFKISEIRVNFAFVDGKHSYDAVSGDARNLMARQRPGDVAIYDDVQIPAVRDVVGSYADKIRHKLKTISCLPNRSYFIAVVK